MNRIIRRCNEGLCTRLSLVFILTLANIACQTNSALDPKGNNAEILERQKSLVRNQLDEGRPEAALGLLRGLARQYPDDASLQNLLGLSHLALKNTGRAIKHFTISYRQAPTPGTALNLSSALIQNGNNEKAIKLLSGLLGSDQGKNYEHLDRIYHNLGYANGQLANLTKAENWFREALAENPSFFPSHLELAKIYANSNRAKLAVQEFRRAIDNCQVCFEPVHALSLLYVRLNQPEEAQKILLSFTRSEDISNQDRERAKSLLRTVTTASIPKKTTG